MRRLLWGSLLVVVALLIWQTLRPLPSTMKNDYAIELGERELAPKAERLDEGLTARFRAQLLEAELLEREDLLANRPEHQGNTPLSGGGFTYDDAAWDDLRGLYRFR